MAAEEGAREDGVPGELNIRYPNARAFFYLEGERNSRLGDGLWYRLDLGVGPSLVRQQILDHSRRPLGLYRVKLGLFRDADLLFPVFFQYLGLRHRFQAIVFYLQDQWPFFNFKGHDLGATSPVLGENLYVSEMPLSVERPNIPVEGSGIV